MPVFCKNCGNQLVLSGVASWFHKEKFLSCTKPEPIMPSRMEHDQNSVYVAHIEVYQTDRSADEKNLRDGGRSKRPIAHVAVRARTIEGLKSKLRGHIDLIEDDGL